MAVAIRMGDNWLAESVAPHSRWVENPGDSAVFPDAGTASAYASARNVTVTTQQQTVTGKKNTGKRSNDL